MSAPTEMEGVAPSTNGVASISAKRKAVDHLDGDSSDDLPLQARVRTKTVDAKKKPKVEPSDGDSDAVNSRRRSTDSKRRAAAKRKLSSEDSGAENSSEDTDESENFSESDSDAPLAKRAKSKSAGKKRASNGNVSSKSTAKRKREEMAKDGTDASLERSNSSKSEPKIKEEKESKPAPKLKKVKVESESDDSAVSRPKPASKKSKPPLKKEVKDEPNGSVSGTPQKKARGKKKAEEDEEEDEQYKWWLQQQGDTSEKWKSLEHNGVFFPPPYKPIGVKMKYDGREIDLDPEAEEVAGFYAQLVGTEWVENPTFRKNFFEDWLAVLAKSKKSHPIKSLEKCDFSPLTEYYAKIRDERKSMTKEQKEASKAEKLALDEKYGWALIDGRKEKIGNFRIEPPGLFRGRGAHPKAGRLKKRVMPEQVVINIGADAKVPDPPGGHQWCEVVHDNTVTWLAYWKENVNDAFKYVFFAAGSSLKGQSDLKKFEKARDLKKHVRKIRNDYQAGLKDELMATRQRSTAMYFIDRLALRAGNEKGEDEADTVGCCSLRYEHVTLAPPNKVIFDFLGKDSIRYYNEVEVEDQVFKNLKIFKKPPKKEGDPLFDRLDTTILNKHLQNYMKGLTAKVFRTYNASHTFQEQLQNTPKDGSLPEKLLAYNRANREVAILCNHQRSVPKAHGNQMEKLKNKVRALKYERRKIREQILELDPKRKRKTEYAEESDLDEDWIEQHEKFLEEQEKERLAKKLEKENERRKEEGEELLTHLDPPVKKTPSLDRLEDQFEKINERIKAQKLAMVDKDENKTTALGTSKINYIDPRISVMWCKKYDVPLEKVFNKSLLTKFKWAMETPGDWEF
ncbi:hypothetical protein M427DRAFT_123840 [Gonapodya prolifera JEL478]|uniref:DNA topoisomerase I n=1 Tax=Gonapodya prolifera (strain JEL478) TaxID=1344416 RepID=A0A139AEG3_GONPJ|nr:hypothetical protein M427DRAFT_123840 [Gonapodya prolifera JEL478]|eukprot:KXS15148.1 hypothetical protein M427DRAFT_123840 [Gonapodya prolifera JEL478]